VTRFPVPCNRSPKDVVTFEELTLSNVWELEALIAVLERKGIVTKPEILDMIQELRHKNPQTLPLIKKHPE